jgi:hypothetical protein
VGYGKITIKNSVRSAVVFLKLTPGSFLERTAAVANLPLYPRLLKVLVTAAMKDVPYPMVLFSLPLCAHFTNTKNLIY